MKRYTTLSAAIALALAGSLAFAGNTADISQDGSGNTGEISQTNADDMNASISTVGDDNNANIVQDDSFFATAAINQDGSDNTATISQTNFSDYGSATIDQIGGSSGNVATITQNDTWEDVGSTASIVQDAATDSTATIDTNDSWDTSASIAQTRVAGPSGRRRRGCSREVFMSLRIAPGWCLRKPSSALRIGYLPRRAISA